jgi:hypothetical protein
LLASIRITVAAVAAVLVLAPAGSAAAPVWTTHSLTRAGSISLPSSWQDFTRQTPRLQTAVRREVIRNPRIGPVLYALTARRSPSLRFIGADLARPSLRAGFVTNVSLLAQRTRGTLDEWTLANVAALRRARSVAKPVLRSTVLLPAGRAVRLRYRQRVQTGTPVERVAVTQYAVARNRTIYLLTFTTLPRQLARYLPVFEQSARSLRLR